MSKYSKDIVIKICDLIEADLYTVTEICRISGISKETHYTWLKTHSDYSDAIKRAKAVFTEKMVIESQQSLSKLVRGFYYEETKKVLDKDGNTKELTISRKYCIPSIRAIIFTLMNLDPDNWKNNLFTEVTGRKGKNLFPAKVLTFKEALAIMTDLSDKEIDVEIEKRRLKLDKVVAN